jgi:hypothetical protein
VSAELLDGQETSEMNRTRIVPVSDQALQNKPSVRRQLTYNLLYVYELDSLLLDAAGRAS